MHPETRFGTRGAPELTSLLQTGNGQMDRTGIEDFRLASTGRAAEIAARAHGRPEQAEPPPLPLSIEVIRYGSHEAIVADWRMLHAIALDDLPFMSPDFVLPAACHPATGDGPDLVAVWELGEMQRTMVGLFPLQKGVASQTDLWSRSRRAMLWKHDLQPFVAPLLAGPFNRASRVVDAFMNWLERQPSISSLIADALPSSSAAAALLSEAAARRRLPVSRRRRPEMTRGLDFKPKGLQSAIDAITLATEPAGLRMALERLLCLDGKRGQEDLIILQDPMQPAMLRAIVRSFGWNGRAIIAEASEARAGALALVGRDKAYLWRVFGSGGADPVTEAALALACERQLGMPVTAASVTPLSGAGTEAVPTEALIIGLTPESSSMVTRLRMLIG